MGRTDDQRVYRVGTTSYCLRHLLVHGLLTWRQEKALITVIPSPNEAEQNDNTIISIGLNVRPSKQMSRWVGGTIDEVDMHVRAQARTQYYEKKDHNTTCTHTIL